MEYHSHISCDLVGGAGRQVGVLCAHIIDPGLGLSIVILEAASVVSRSHIKPRLMCSGIKPYMLCSIGTCLIGVLYKRIFLFKATGYVY